MVLALKLTSLVRIFIPLTIFKSIHCYLSMELFVVLEIAKNLSRKFKNK